MFKEAFSEKTSHAFMFLFLGCLIGLAYCIERANFPLVLALYSLAFFIYILILRKNIALPLPLLMRYGLLFRFAVLFALPLWSDDFYRYIWDGRLLNLGINPFEYLPATLYHTEKIAGFDMELFQLLNSPNYYSVYPPLAQALFMGVAKIFPHSVYWTTIALKMVFFIAEIGIVYLLPKFLTSLGKSNHHSLLYVFNPLIILEFMGNMHLECIMIFFVLLFLVNLYQKKYWSGGLFLGLAVLTKLIPLLFIPFLLRFIPIKNFLKVFIMCLLILVMGFTPFIDEHTIGHFSQSIELYFSCFEFNASLYYLLRQIGWWILNYNPIAYLGPTLKAITLIVGLYMAFRKPIKKFDEYLKSITWMLMLYFLLSTTIHPWYISTLLFLAVFSTMSSPVIWTFAVVFSYSAYNNASFQENHLLLALEYLMVLAGIYLDLYKPGLKTIKWMKSTV